MSSLQEADVQSLRVLFVIPDFAGGGAQRQMVLLANALASGPSMHIGVAYLREGVWFEKLQASKVHLLRMDSLSNLRPSNVYKLRTIIGEWEPDVVFSWLHPSDVTVGLAMMLPPRPGLPWVVAERDSWYPSRLRFRLRDRLAARADLVVANSRAGDLYWAERGVPVNRRRLIGNILSEEWLREPPVRRDAHVCYAGRLEHQKNVVVVAEAFSRLSAAGVLGRFSIVGDGTLLSEVQSVVGSNSVTISPFTPDALSLFRDVTVLVNISGHEGVPNTVIENLALGNRVLLSRIDEHTDLVGKEYPHLIAPDADAAAVSEAICRAADDPVHMDEYRRTLQVLASMRAGKVAAAYAKVLGEVVRWR